MNQNVIQCLESYCEKEIETLKKCRIFDEINSLSLSLGYSIDISFGEAYDAKKERYPKKIYLSFSILDKTKETVVANLLDFEHLSDATEILEIDRKKRVKFFSWQEDDEFVESLEWIKRELEKKNQKNK